MKSKRKPVQVAASVTTGAGDGTQGGPPPKPKSRSLTYRESRFVEEYVSNGGNGTLAARTAGYSSCWAEIASQNLNKLHIREALVVEREEQRRLINFKKEDALRILTGMAGATLDQFTELFDDPGKKRNYRKLGSRRFALDCAKRKITYEEDGSKSVTTEIKIISAGERRATVNDLWEKLGLGHSGNTESGENPAEAFSSELEGLEQPSDE